MTRKKIIAIDFDGTITMPEENPHLLLDFTLRQNAKEVIAWIQEHFFAILWTCRDNNELYIALNFLNKHNIHFDAVNEDAPFLKFKPSRKIFADRYIDDKVYGSTLDWLQIKANLIEEFLDPADEKIIKQVVKIIC